MTTTTIMGCIPSLLPPLLLPLFRGVPPDDVARYGFIRGRTGHQELEEEPHVHHTCTTCVCLEDPVNTGAN